MLHPSTKKLIDRLSDMTARGKLTWKEGHDDSVVYATEGYSVALSTAPHELIITSKDGKELERATTEELAATPLESGGTYTEAIASMRAQAARIARGTETAISSLLAGIEQSEVPAAEAAPVSEESDVAEATIEDPTDESTTQAMFASPPEDPAEPAAQPEDEPDMTAAVARLADEVNTREQAQTPSLASGTLTAAATDLAVSVALAERTDTTDQASESEALAAEPSEALVTETDSEPELETPDIQAAPIEQLDTTETETSDETPAYSSMSSETNAVLEASESTLEAEVETVETAVAEPEQSAVWTPTEPSTPETETYVPFGLSEKSETASETVTGDPKPVTDLDATQEPDLTEPHPEPERSPEAGAVPFTIATSETQGPEVETGETSILGDPLSESLSFGDAAPETELPSDPLTTATSNEEVATPEPELAAPVTETADALVSEALSSETLSVEETQAVEEVETGATPVETALTEPDLAATAALESEPVAPPPLETASEPVLTTEEPSELAETPPSAPAETSEPRSYSLSGIGAGFGLGAMTSTVGATGGPGVSGTAGSEKIIIDATDEVPLSDVPAMATAEPEPEPATATPVATEEPLAEAATEPATDPVSEPPVATEHTAPETETASEAEAAKPEEEAEEEAPVSLTTPRTRFNPWS